MSKIRILITGDSQLVQEKLMAIIMSDHDLKVVGAAGKGNETIEMVETFHPDLVIMYIFMPVLEGLETISHIMATHPVAILVISDNQDFHVAFAALKRGALEVMPKSDLHPGKPHELIQKIKLLAKVKVIRHIGGKKWNGVLERPISSKANNHCFDRVVAIASSTGGPRALVTILSGLPAEFPYPILIAQHIDHGFIEGLVDFINSECSLKVKLGIRGENIASGVVYISPANKHMEINTKGKITLIEKVAKDIYHPSCNRLLSSTGRVFGENSIGVILTGMGDDGVKGIVCIKEQGGVTLAQDENSSIVFGMPKVAIESGKVDKVFPLNEISSYLIRLAEDKGRPMKESENNFRRIS